MSRTRRHLLAGAIDFIRVTRKLNLALFVASAGHIIDVSDPALPDCTGLGPVRRTFVRLPDWLDRVSAIYKWCMACWYLLRDVIDLRLRSFNYSLGKYIH